MNENQPTRKPSKKVMHALGRVLAAEIEGRPLFQSTAKIYASLCDEGLLEKREHFFGTPPFRVKCEGYELTNAGRYLYCSNC